MTYLLINTYFVHLTIQSYLARNITTCFYLSTIMKITSDKKCNNLRYPTDNRPDLMNLDA